MRILMIQNNKINPQRLLREFLSKYGEVSEINFTNLSQEQFDFYNAFDLVVLSGSGWRQLVGNENLYQTEIDFIKQTTVPIFGICFGMELIAKALEQEIVRQEKRQGLYVTEISSGEHVGTKVPVVFSSMWYLSKSTTGIISGEITPVSESISHGVRTVDAFAVPGRNIFATQFHPEKNIPRNDGWAFFEGALKGFGLPFESQPHTEINKFQK